MDVERKVLALVDKEFSSAIESLFRATIYLEKIDSDVFRATIGEIKDVIKNLDQSNDLLIDYINKKDFPEGIVD